MELGGGVKVLLGPRQRGPQPLQLQSVDTDRTAKANLTVQLCGLSVDTVCTVFAVDTDCTAKANVTVQLCGLSVDTDCTVFAVDTGCMVFAVDIDCTAKANDTV